MITKRNTALLILTLLVFAGNGCKKEDTPESQGTNFNRLLKTVETNSGSTGVTTIEYTYNTNGQLQKIQTSVTGVAGSVFSPNQVNYFRNVSGRLDSTQLIYMPATGALQVITSTLFNYDVAGRITLVKSISRGGANWIDSALYVYSGSTLSNRQDYRSFDNGSTFSLLRTVAFRFDGAGNLDRAVFNWTSPASTDTIQLSYDNKPNPVRDEKIIFYWGPFFYEQYQPSNNVAGIKKSNGEQYQLTYQYHASGKPLVRQMVSPAGGNTVETKYYYD